MRLCGGYLPWEAPGGTTTVAAASSGALESAPIVTTELSVCGSLDALGAGHLPQVHTPENQHSRPLPQKTSWKDRGKASY